MRQHFYILISIVIAAVFTGCATTKQLQQTQAQTARVEQQLDSALQRLSVIESQMTQMQKQVTELNKQLQNKPASTVPATQPVVPNQAAVKKWNTAQMRGAKATVEFGGKTYKATCATTAYWDSIVIISVSMAFGIEIARVEATPTEVLVVNKLEKEYDRATYAEINKDVRPFVTYEDLRTIAGGEMPSIAQNGVLRYSAKGQTVALALNFVNPPLLNSSVTIHRVDVSKFKKIKLLK